MERKITRHVNQERERERERERESGIGTTSVERRWSEREVAVAASASASLRLSSGKRPQMREAGKPHSAATGGLANQKCSRFQANALRMYS